MYEPGMGPNLPRLRRGWGGQTKRRGPILPGLCSFYAPSQSAIGKWDWGFHTVRGGVGPEELDFRPRVVGVVEIWKDV